MILMAEDRESWIKWVEAQTGPISEKKSYDYASI